MANRTTTATVTATATTPLPTKSTAVPPAGPALEDSAQPAGLRPGVVAAVALGSAAALASVVLGGVALYRRGRRAGEHAGENHALRAVYPVPRSPPAPPGRSSWPDASGFGAAAGRPHRGSEAAPAYASIPAGPGH